MVWTHHGERRTNRIFVFLKKVLKTSFFTKITKKQEKEPNAARGSPAGPSGASSCCRTRRWFLCVCISSSGGRESPSSSSSPYTFPAGREPRRTDTRSGGPADTGEAGKSISAVCRAANQRAGFSGTCAHRYLLQTHLLLTAVCLAAAVNLQRHDLPVAANVFEDLKHKAQPDRSHGPIDHTAR